MDRDDLDAAAASAVNRANPLRIQAQYALAVNMPCAGRR
jgi:hypothetical protein